MNLWLEQDPYWAAATVFAQTLNAGPAAAAAEPPLHKFRAIKTRAPLMNLTNKPEEGLLLRHQVLRPYTGSPSRSNTWE